VRILFVSANDSDAYLDIEREQRTLLKLAETNGHSLKFLPGVQISDLEHELAGKNGKRADYDVLHFAGHGTRRGLRMRGKGDNDFEDLSGEKLAQIIAAARQGKAADDGLRLVVLNACSTEPVAEKIQSAVAEVIGTTRDIKDRTARSFSSDFYAALNDRATVREAFDKSADEEEGPYIRRPKQNPDRAIRLPSADETGQAKIEGLGAFYEHYYGDYIDAQIRSLERDRRLNNYVFYGLLGIAAVLWIYLLNESSQAGDIPGKLMAALSNAMFPEDSEHKPFDLFSLDGLWARVKALDAFAPVALAFFQKRLSSHIDPKVQGLNRLRDSIRMWDDLPDEDREMIRSVMHESLKESLQP